MIVNKTWLTAQTASGFGLPMTAATFGTGLGTSVADTFVGATAPTYAVRDRHVAGIGLALASRPGPTAWSPPPC